ncbi:hypothetical protein WJX79_008642 [Trebouxia sp. C0005]
MVLQDCAQIAARPKIPRVKQEAESRRASCDFQSPKGWSYKDLAEDSNASLASGSQMQRTHSNFSAISRATSVATSLISRTHSTFLQKHKKFGLMRKSLWDKAQQRDLSFCVFARTSPVRKLAIQIVENPWFNRLVLAIIMANCVFLAIANPQCDTEVEIANNPECAGNPKWQRIIDANYFFTAAFSIEVVVQAIAKNFIIGPNAYLKNGWSWLDFITTLTSYTPYLPGNATDVSSLRAFRALRPLRTLSAHPGIRLLVSTLISAIPLLLDVVLLLTWVFFVFGIIGMQLFMGRLLGRCHPLNTSTLQPEAVPENMTDQVCNPVQSSGTYNCGDGYVCLNGDYEAFYGDVSFDNIGRALLQVLQVVSLESWSTTQMYYLLDGIGNVVFIYYFCLIVIGTYFALNLLVAVISAKFAQLHVDSQKAILARDRAAPNMSANVRFYIEFLVSMLLKREDLMPWAEQSYPRRVARRVVDDPWFNRFVMSIVLVNIVIMALYHADMSDGFADALETTNLVLTILFTIEMVIKHAALGILGYWSNGFNALDGIIVIASLVDLGLQYSGTSNSHGGGGVSSLRVLRLLRVLRSLKLLRQVEGLNKIVNVVLKSMVALRDFMLLLLLFIFIFMVLGIQLFGGNSYYTPANTATWRKGFASFYESFYTDALSPHSPASNQVMPFGSRAGGGADMMWGDPYPSGRMGTPEGRHLEGRSMLSPPALGSSRRQGSPNDPSGGRRSSQEGLWGRLSSQEALGGISRQSLFGGLSALASSRHLGSPEGNGGKQRRSSAENAGTSPGGRAPPLGAAAKRGSFFMPDLPRQSGTRDFEHMHNFTKLVRGQAPQPGAYHNVLRMRRWLVSLDSTYGVKDWQVVKTQMDQEAEIMKQSMARQEAAQQAVPQEEDEQAGPLRTASSAARGLFATFSKKRKKGMWDQMLKRKVAGNLGKQKNSDNLDDLASTHGEEEDHSSRVNSQAALLGGGMSSNEWVPGTLSPNPTPSHTHQLPPLEQPRLLSKKGLLSALSNSKRLLPGLMKKDNDLAEAAARGGLTHQRSGGLANRMETAGSVDSNAALLPAAIPSEQASISNVQLAAAMTDGQALTDGQTDPGQAQFLEVAGFAGAVAQAYAAYDYVSLGVFTDQSLIRRFCMRVITNVYFEGIVLMLVLLSSVLLALDTPSLDDSSRLADVITICDLIFVACFTLEMCLKVVALGLVAHPGAYLRSPWNQLDAVVVITSIVSTASPNNHVGILKALRLLRVLRPLRMISRFKGMQIVVLALIRSIPPISSVAMFGLFEFVIFAIIGIQLFAGRLGACNQVEIDGAYVQYKSQCIEGVTFTCNGTQDNNCNDGDATIRQWQVAFYNFDNMASALLSVVEVAVMDNYMDDCAYFLMDATGINKQPQLWHNPWAGLYIVAVCFFLGLFWVNLLQGAIIDNYCRLIEQMGSGALLTDEQKKWLDVLRLKGTTRQGQKDNSLNPVNRIRSVCFDVVTHRWFDPAILCMIILNMVAICTTYRGQGQTYTNVLSDINIFFTAVYLAEAVLKNTAFGPLKYIKDNWNKLDLVIVILALVDIFVTSSKVSSLSSAFRIFRVVRLLKVLQQVKGLRTLFNTLLSSLPAVFNVGSLLFLMFFIYAILGMNLFGTQDNELSQQDPHANFLSFGASMLTLFRLSTSDSWDQILQSSQGCPIFNVACDAGGKAIISAIYCISFIFGVNFIMLNLVIAVIIDQFVESAGREGLFLDNTLFEILHKKMLLDRFLKRLRTKVRTYQEREQAANKKSKRGRRKSVLLFGGPKQQKVGFDPSPEGTSKQPLREPSLGKSLESAFLTNLFRTPSNNERQPGLVLSRGGSAVEPPLLIRGRSTQSPAISRSATQNPQSLVEKVSSENSRLS